MPLVSPSERNDFGQVPVSPFVALGLGAVPHKKFKASETLVQSFKEQWFLHNAYSPYANALMFGDDSDAFLEKQMEVVRSGQELGAPRGFLENVESFAASLIGGVAGMPIETALLFTPAGLGMVGSIASGASRAAGALAVSNNVVGRTLFMSGAEGLAFGGIEQTRKMAQRAVADIEGIRPDDRHALLEGFIGGAVGGLVFHGGGALLKAGRNKLTGRELPVGNEHATYAADPYFIPDASSKELGFNGELYHQARVENVPRELSQDVWRDSAGNVYEGGIEVAASDHPWADVVKRVDIPVHDGSWSSNPIRYDAFLSRNIGRFSESVIGKSSAAERTIRSGVSEGEVQALNALQAKYPYVFNEYSMSVGEVGAPLRDFMETASNLGAEERARVLESRTQSLEKVVDDLTAQAQKADIQKSPTSELIDSQLKIAESMLERLRDEQTDVVNRLSTSVGVSAEPVSTQDLFTGMTDEAHRKASAEFVKAIVQQAKDSPDQFTFLKNFIDSLTTAKEVNLSLKYQFTRPLMEVYDKIAKETIEEFLGSSGAQKRVMRKFKDRSVVLNKEEQAIYEALKDTAYIGREMQGMYGWNIGYVEDHLPVQFKDPAVMIENGIDSAGKFADECIDPLDWARMGFVEEIDGVETVLSEQVRRQYLERVYEEIVNGDFTKPIESGKGRSGSSEFARRNKSRAFHYKDVDVQYEHMIKFGGAQNLFEAVMQHGNSVSNRLTQHVILGASPRQTAEILLRELKPILGGKEYSVSSKNNFFGAGDMFKKAFYRTASLESVLNELTQVSSWHPEGGFMGKALHYGSRMLTSSRLGGLYRYGVEDIVRSVLASKELKFTLKDMLAEVMPGGAPNKAEASYLGILMEDMRNIYPDEANYTKWDRAARNFGVFMHKWSGSTFVTNRQKRIIGKNFYRNVASNLQKDYRNIDSAFRSHLERYGVSEADWSRLQKLPYTRDVDGVKLYSPRDVFLLENNLDRQAVLRLNQSMYGFMAQGVVEANKFASAAFFGSTRERGTIFSALAHSMKTFMGAPTSLSYNFVASSNMQERLWKEILWVTASGMLMDTMKDISRGEIVDFSQFDNLDYVRYALESYKSGGGFGILSDYTIAIVLSAIGEHPKEDIQREITRAAGGAPLQLTAALAGDTLEMVNLLMHGENSNLLSHIENWMPNLPGIDLFGHRIIFGTMKEMFHEDPTIAEDRRERSRARRRRRAVL